MSNVGESERDMFRGREILARALGRLLARKWLREKGLLPRQMNAASETTSGQPSSEGLPKPK